jgi:CRISPR-associated protein Csm5
MTTYDLRISLISPVHIGTGVELRKEFDFITQHGCTYRLDEDAILADFIDQIRPDAFGNYPTLEKILTKAGAQNTKYYRYKLKGMLRSGKTDARLQECIKDIADQPYIPGSSIKGALRTALAWSGWEESNVKLTQNKLGRRKYWAGQKLEREIFGRDPNHDLLRALRVSDCTSKDASRHLVVVNAQVLTLKELGSPIELEAIGGDAVFTGAVTLDGYLFSAQAEQKLGFSEKRAWLSNLLVRAQQHSRARIEKMMSWYSKIDRGERVVNFLSKLLSFEAQPNQALIQLGWGTGWDGKTFWTHLMADQYQFEKILKDYQMVKKGKRQPGDPFPKSRRVIMSGNNQEELPLAPFGWCLVEMTRPEQ